MENRDLLLQQSKELILKLNAELEETIKELDEKNNKLRTYQKITDCQDWYTFSEAAKMLDMEIPNRKPKKKFGRNTLIDFSKEHGILRGNREPYQYYVDSGCFKHYLKERLNSNEIDIVPLASIKGIELLRRFIDESNDE